MSCYQVVEEYDNGKVIYICSLYYKIHNIALLIKFACPLFLEFVDLALKNNK